MDLIALTNDDADMRRLRAHNGFEANPGFVAELTNETAAVKCANHRDRGAVLARRGQPPLCGECALRALGVDNAL